MISETAAVIVRRDGRYLMVEEHTADGVRLNQPAGHVEEGETPKNAAVRECLEEARMVVRPLRLISSMEMIGRSRDESLNPHFKRFNYEGEVVHELPFENQSEEVIRRLWMTFDEIKERKDDLRSPATLWAIEDYERELTLFGREPAQV